MKITREGKTYELTRDELYAAFVEMRDIFDVEEIRNELDNRMNGDDPAEAEAAEKAMANTELLEELAEQLRDYLDYYDVNYRSAVEQAADCAIDRMKEE